MDKEIDYNRISSASEEAQDFIKRCLMQRAQDRPSASDLLKHEWLLDASLVSVARLDRKSSAFQEMKKATARDEFQAAVTSYITNMIV